MANNNPRCLYYNNLIDFFGETDESILGKLCDRYHGDAKTTTREAWEGEITVMKGVLSLLRDKRGKIIFEYDIPRLGKRIDVVLLYRGIVFCLEFKVGETRILEADVDQVLDYALDLKNFHRFSRDKVIVPILIATNYGGSSTDIQMSVYDDQIVNPLVTGESGILGLINAVLDRFPAEDPVDENWIISPYAPTSGSERISIKLAATARRNSLVQRYVSNVVIVQKKHNQSSRQIGICGGDMQ